MDKSDENNDEGIKEVTEKDMIICNRALDCKD